MPWEKDRFFWEDFDFEESLELAASCYYTPPLATFDNSRDYQHNVYDEVA